MISGGWDNVVCDMVLPSEYLLSMIDALEQISQSIKDIVLYRKDGLMVT